LAKLDSLLKFFRDGGGGTNRTNTCVSLFSQLKRFALTLQKERELNMAPGYAPPSVSRESTNMFDSVRNFDGYESWGPHELADYFENCGLADYREVLIYHKITGKIAPNLTDDDLKDMGIKIVGDRCRFRHILKSLGRKSRQMQREKVRII
jgi:uncharacterized protein with von Willebrand factor type A (vWA) domain